MKLRLGLGTLREKLKGKDKYEMAENYSILGIVLGVVMISSGFLLSILNPKGLSTILLMFGSLLSFLSTLALIFVWLIKELVS